MKLADLRPKWVTLNGWSLPDRPFYIGLTFYCPHCAADLPEHGEARKQRLAVSFWPPIDPTNAKELFASPLPRSESAWSRVTGDTFDTLTLIPSIDTSAHKHWHGNITNGEMA